MKHIAAKLIIIALIASALALSVVGLIAANWSSEPPAVALVNWSE